MNLRPSMVVQLKVRLLTASKLVPPALVLHWQATYPWDNDHRGCYLTAKRMGLLLGAAAETVEEQRRELCRLGLMTRIGHGPASSWKLEFPAHLLPDHPRLTPEETEVLAGRLDAWIRAQVEGRPPPTPAKPPGIDATEPRQKRRDNPAESPAMVGGETRRTSRVSRALGEGDKGGEGSGVPNESNSLVLHLLAVESGGLKEARARHIDEEEQEKVNAPTPDERRAAWHAAAEEERARKRA